MVRHGLPDVMVAWDGRDGTTDAQPAAARPYAAMVESFLVAFGVIFVAELGDKSQFVVLAFASRYRAVDVLVGVTIAAAALAGVSVLLGATVAVAIPTDLLAFGGGLLFLVFAVLALRDDDDDDHAVSPAAAMTRSAIVTVAVAFFVAELGDKTMLATFTLGGRQEPIGTWLGATAGEVAVGMLAIVVGRTLGRRLPAHVLRYASAAAFAIFGVVLIGEGLGLW
jgi:putative Ca2+/H+ antiporter (TMEM165/GDT1 family)